MSTPIIALFVAAFVIILIAAGYNQLVTLRNKVNEAYSTMDVYLKKRFDLVPELVAVVRGYAVHESATLENITKSRTNGMDDHFKGENQIASALGKIMVVAEAYPELKANKNFLDLQKELSKIEEDIAASRRYYNGSVREYNNSCQTVPSNIIAMLFHFTAKPMFEASDEERKIANYEI